MFFLDSFIPPECINCRTQGSIRAQIIALRLKPLHHVSNNFGDICIRCILPRDQRNPFQQDISMCIEQLISSVGLIRGLVDMQFLDLGSVK
jgi:hypothetical protein